MKMIVVSIWARYFDSTKP